MGPPGVVIGPVGCGRGCRLRGEAGRDTLTLSAPRSRRPPATTGWEAVATARIDSDRPIGRRPDRPSGQGPAHRAVAERQAGWWRAARDSGETMRALSASAGAA